MSEALLQCLRRLSRQFMSQKFSSFFLCALVPPDFENSFAAHA